jgi:mono/diheme cytochrome c family protein
VFTAALAGAALAATPAALGSPSAKSITVRVTDSGFRLSARQAPVGVLTFNVVNAGKRKHSFRIAGKKAPVLDPGKRARVVVDFKWAGNYAYASTVAGDVARGLEGVFTVKPAKTVAVTATDTALRLSTGTAPLGSVGFVVRNTGTKAHDFRIAGKKTPRLAPKARATLVVNFKRAGKYPYSSTVAGDAAKGLKGTFTVTAKKPAPASSGANVAAGKQVFATAGCGACHTLAAAGAGGLVGPSLDTSRLSRATVIARITNGKGAMPAYEGTLTGKQIEEVAAFLVESRSG